MRPLILFLALTPSALAASTRPTWVQQVDVIVSDGVQFINQTTITGPIFGLANFHDPRSLDGTNSLLLVDFQGATEPPSLDIIRAGWFTGVPYPVSLFVSTFPASPEPPMLTEIPDYHFGLVAGGEFNPGD